ncbi:helix-turn-helix transcriptional regulator [Lapillicoccus sp.]|uniref:helix-turn-helix domain-containing protein n=1 Tax=Lapillicoccus sp. TaxID=1909287 RepID=UPI003266E914
MAIDDEWDPRLRQLGEYIRGQRQMADLSLRGLSQLTQVSNAYLSQIERGLHQPSLRVLESIAVALNLSSETLLSQAGMRQGSSATGPTVHADTETAIRTDPDLTPEAQDTLIRVYRGFKRPQDRA